jgi:hypothetical protein
MTRRYQESYRRISLSKRPSDGANIACGGAAQTSYDSATTHQPGDLAFSVSLALAQVVAFLSNTENYKFRAVTAVVPPDRKSEHPLVGCMDSAFKITDHILHSGFDKTSQPAKQKSSTRQQCKNHITLHSSLFYILINPSSSHFVQHVRS